MTAPRVQALRDQLERTLLRVKYCRRTFLENALNNDTTERGQRTHSKLADEARRV